MPTERTAADLLADAQAIKKVLAQYSAPVFQSYDEEYQARRAALIADANARALLPSFIRTCRDLADFESYAREGFSSSDALREHIRKEMDALFTHLETETYGATPRAPSFADDTDNFVGRIARLLAERGRTREVAMLTLGECSLEEDPDDNTSWGTPYRLEVSVSPRLYVETDAGRDSATRTIKDAANELRDNRGEFVSYVAIVPNVKVLPEWKEGALRWLRGEGVNNQGRVRSDNVAARECDGLLFRSEPEIYLYQALKAAGVTFAPLPVFLRGGRTYERLEPDFVVFRKGCLMLIEVDGDTVHVETPAEADQRTRLFKHEGALIERVPASECDTKEKAAARAVRLLADFDTWIAAR